MSRGRNTITQRPAAEGYGRAERKSLGLSFQELVLAERLRGVGMNWSGVARCTGRSIPDLQRALNPAAYSRKPGV